MTDVWGGDSSSREYWSREELSSGSPLGDGELVKMTPELPPGSGPPLLTWEPGTG